VSKKLIMMQKLYLGRGSTTLIQLYNKLIWLC